jgi:hypothetical protein
MEVPKKLVHYAVRRALLVSRWLTPSEESPLWAVHYWIRALSQIWRFRIQIASLLMHTAKSHFVHSSLPPERNPIPETLPDRGKPSAGDNYASAKDAHFSLAVNSPQSNRPCLSGHLFAPGARDGIAGGSQGG